MYRPSQLWLIISMNRFNCQLTISSRYINISTANNLLTIESNVKSVMADSVGYKDDEDTPKEDEHMVHKGISKRQFTRTFTLADDVVVNGAELKDGMLVIDLEKIVPEEKKPKTIKIK